MGTAITLTSSDPATTIRYTVNGADPTASDTTLASGGEHPPDDELHL